MSAFTQLPHPNVPPEKAAIFRIHSSADFVNCALRIFRNQAKHNSVYSEYIKRLQKDESKVMHLADIPFLPISFFKTHQVITGKPENTLVFESSGTTGDFPSRHYVADPEIYITSFTQCFELFFGKPDGYCILALLPSYLERKNASLVFMVDHLVKKSQHPRSGFFLDNYKALSDTLQALNAAGTKTILIGVAFALLEFAEKFPASLENIIIMETGGMKGRRAEVTREELHAKLMEAFGVASVYSEYGMTELLSQAYSTDHGVFRCPPWMQVVIRNPYDPFEYQPPGSSGAINIIDLANINSCCFIQTDDLGKLHPDGTFEVLGRLDGAELRGCNLMLG